MTARYGISEWYGNPFLGLEPEHRRTLAATALDRGATPPPCPFKAKSANCHKRGGVCSIQRYEEGEDGGIGAPVGDPVITCPARFEERKMVARWLGEILGYPEDEIQVATEVPFLSGSTTGKAAGKIDMVIASGDTEDFDWCALEIQAVYFSGTGMQSEFLTLQNGTAATPPFPDAVRRPDWRSSSAKRLMPQLQIKGAMLRTWGNKLAVAVDRPFFDAIGGASASPTQEIPDNNVIWLVPEIRRTANGPHRLERGHWESLSLEDSSRKLLAAERMRKVDFVEVLRARLRPLDALGQP